jgi:hypothetical protein
MLVSVQYHATVLKVKYTCGCGLVILFWAGTTISRSQDAPTRQKYNDPLAKLNGALFEIPEVLRHGKGCARGRGAKTDQAHVLDSAA